MRTLLITSEPQCDPCTTHTGSRPTSASCALVDVMRKRGDHVFLLHASPSRETSHSKRQMGHSGIKGWALALKAFRQRHEYDFILTEDESVSLPLALLLRKVRTRPQHIFIGRAIAGAGRLLPSASQVLFNALDLQQGYDLLFVASEAERDFFEDKLGVLWDKIVLMPPPVDDVFFYPRTSPALRSDQTCAIVGAEQKGSAFDEALRSLPDLTVIWPDEGNRDDVAMRNLYAACAFVVVPQDTTASATGALLTLQAMAMGKAVLAAKSESGSDIVLEGITGLTVAHDDLDAWRAGLASLRSDVAFRERLGRNGRRWIEEHAAQERWVARVAGAISHSPYMHEGNVTSPPDAYMTMMRGFG